MDSGLNNAGADPGTFRSIRRGSTVWLAIIGAESVNGTIREMLVVPRLGEFRARQLSFGIAVVLILLITMASIKWIGERNNYRLLLIGFLWAVFTFCFELILGFATLGAPLERFRSDYDVTSGGMMPFGLAFLIIAPLLAARLFRLEAISAGSIG
jgi:hypothetical protein